MKKIINKKNNIVLIGMPGAGKSTVGVILAKALGYSFCDTDLLIQNQEGAYLQQIIDKKDIKYFLDREKEIICSLNFSKYVIATGGSAVYKKESMKHLKEIGIIIYLETSYHVLKKRISNMKTRGIAMERAQTFKDIYIERIPLYEHFAEITIICKKKSIEKITEEIISQIKMLINHHRLIKEK